ncbi:MAG TPA: HEAT repeat domain-containing protein [Pyrinomonadaceae bacterium]|nr:HEAT repeat domain-containing protein [Pyrinomonadaceae bacterium]
MDKYVRRRPTVAFSLLALALSAFAVTASPTDAQTAVTDDGYQIEVTLSPDKDTIMLGEPSFISFEIRNFSSVDLCVTEGGDYRNNIGRPDSYKVTVTGEGGKPVPQPEVTIWMGGFIGCSRIPANGIHVTKLFLPHWATFESAGSYTVNVKKSLRVESYAPKSPRSVVKADVTAHIKIIPYDDSEMGKIIDSLGSAMLDIDDPESSRSAQALAYINDRRAIKYFAQALEKFGKAQDGTDVYFTSRQAAAALSKFNDDSAVAALEAAMGSPNEETRLDVASALESSEHPKALSLLLKMRGDGYWFVRLRVAQGLKRLDSSESIAVLSKMLRDENKDVREAAETSLKALGHQQ